ncbi:MAG: transporter substrate-binding domain-containing protein [Clostridia bacterium]|nr:transporter substrate-binding domain-containing protein [Clostridia bacterium]
MKSAKIAAILLALLTVSMLAGCNFDLEGQTEPVDQLILGTAADYAPFEFHAVIGGQDTIVGADIELAKKIAADMGKELVIKDIAFENLLSELNKGNVDLVISDMMATSARMEEAEASDEYYKESDQKVVMLKKNAETYTSFDALAGAKLAVQKGSVQVEVAKAHLDDCELVEIQAVDEMFYRLASGEVDVLLVSGNVADSHVAANTQLVVLDQAFPETEGGRVWVAKNDPQGLMEQINKTVDFVKINNLYSGWLEEAAALN